MSYTPRYNYPTGTEVAFGNENMVLHSTTEDGYEFVNTATGEIDFTSFSKFATLLKSPAMKIENSTYLTTGVLELRLGDFKVAEQLEAPQRENGEFNHAVCCAAASLRTRLRMEKGDHNFRLTGRILDESQNRKYVSSVAGDILGKKVYSKSVRGGRNSDWVLYRGRTILKYLKIYDELGCDDNVVAALATLDHLKGNRTQRLPIQILELMTEAWEEVGLDLKGTAPSNVHDHLTMLINEHNQTRKRNGLNTLNVPSQKTLMNHRLYLQSPTEYMVATKGEVHSRTKRGRGSTDLRALLPGELVEIDECKLSLITSAKEHGFWERLSDHHQNVLEELDHDIRMRLSLLVMIDVATRMPLAWVLSDQPKAEATLALLRMATRDKTKEKIKYGCQGNPPPPMGLGMIKSDNGVGLRNQTVISSAIGLGASYTSVRTYSPSDKPYVERILGTTESIVIKLTHGYTGRKAGELPGYDSEENGVLDTEELYGILTRFFIDEYPSRRHMGVGMGGRRPAEVLEELNKTRGLFRPMNEDERRIQLGWKVEVTPNDEGVRVFSGIWYSSKQFQVAVDEYPATKVSVYIDPENVNEATAVIPGVASVFRLQLQVTAFADLTVPEVLELTQAYLREHPSITDIYEDRIASMRRKLFDQLRKIGVEKKLPRSYSTFDECAAKASHLYAGTRIVRSFPEAQTVPPGEISSNYSGPGVFPIGGDEAVIERQENDVNSDRPHKSADNTRREQSKVDNKHTLIGRPKKKGTFK